MRIFVSIAAYRDPQLLPTVRDALAKARRPEALRFGICWQHGPEESLEDLRDDPRFRVIDVDWRQSRGACWARAEVMGRYEGEEYFLQLDSHHRFVDAWDEKLLRHLELAESDKPVLSTYLPSFTPDEPSSFADAPTQMNFDRFTSEGIILFRPSVISGWQTRDRPVRGRFLSGHFLFAPGAFVEEVPYDPELYFTGEEITLAIRAFTHGWDFFAPCEVLLWHEYTRAYRPHKHWTDHNAENQIEVQWHERDVASRERVRRFLEQPHIGRYGCGTARSFGENEAFAGVSFAARRAQEYTRNFLEPPNPPAPADWASRIARYDFEIPIERALLPEGAERALFWYVGFHDSAEGEIHRQDAGAEEIGSLFAAGGDTIRLRRGFESAREPASWLIWPYTAADGWIDRIRGEIHIVRPPVTTFVTALLDIGRDTLAGSFRRSFEEEYWPAFEKLLGIDAPLVVYVEPEREPLVWRCRSPLNTKVVTITKRDLEAGRYFDRANRIRRRDEWRGQASWLAESPQAALPHYNPLVFNKILWLREVALENPFGTSAFFWVDAALTRTVGEGALLDRQLPMRLAEVAQAPVFAAYPYRGSAEVHGFESEALAREAGVDAIEHVVRGGFFGGRAPDLAALGALYQHWLSRTLDQGLMGTEESIFTLLAHRYPELLTPYRIGADGLLGPLLRDLLERGPALPRESLRATDPEALAVEEAPALDGTFGTDPEGAARGAIHFFGLPMMQNRNAPQAFDALWRHLAASGRRVRRIVEIGTGAGGLSVLFSLYCTSVGADFVTFDHNPHVVGHPAFQRLGIEQRADDVREPFVRGEIARLLQEPGLTLLVLDGGDKIDDAEALVDYLKLGDLLLLHDYAQSRAHFEAAIDGRLWSWCEVTDEALKGLSVRNGLEEVLPELFHRAVWTCREKRGTSEKRAPRANTASEATALYAISFNLPQQFRLWLESVERADPDLLRRTDKFLLDNSSDERTTPAYAELCERYGFVHLREPNLGITGGRLYCAERFARGEHELMLYFEDDMLISGDDGLCANGMPTHVPNLFGRALPIIRGEEGLDYLKLSFSEFYGDHRINWAYKNLDDEARERFFPGGRHETRIEAIRSHEGLAYLVGEVYYSNWPMLITRRGSETLFGGQDAVPRHEAGLMVRSLELSRAGRLRGGVLLASPIRHQRDHHYDAGERREA